MSQKDPKRRSKRAVRIATMLDPERDHLLLDKIDEERQSLGRCSRAVIVRMALVERYKERVA